MQPFTKLTAQTTIHVPTDVPTIQGGIDAAHSGDTVLVEPGTYTENLDFKGKAITVTSGATSYAGAAGTVLQGAGSAAIVIFHSNETRASVLNGFTIQNGTSSAVYLSGASATITNNVIANNLGCALSVVGQAASPLISGNDIAYTGMIPSTECAPPGYVVGGGVPGTAVGVNEAGNVEIIGNMIENNGASIPNTNGLQYQGGGITAASSNSITTLLVKNNVIRNNIGLGNGVALAAYEIAHLSIVQNLIYGNMASSGTPGINTLADVLFRPRNVTFSQMIVNNTVYGNTNVHAAQDHPAQTGDQAGFGDENPIVMSPFAVENNLFVATDPYGTVACATDFQSPLTYQNNDAFYAGAIQPLLCTPSGSLLAVDPQFVNPAALNFQIPRTSPVVGAGDINASNLPPADLAGKNRTVCGSIDLGVYQTHPQPPISLSSTPNPSVGGSNSTISAHLTGNCNIPTGTVTFFDGATQLGTGTLDTNGNTSLTTAALTVGSHTLTATYPGDFNFDPSTSISYVQVVTGYPTATTLQVAPNPANALQAITFSATASSQFGVPGGTITFFAGTNALGSAAINAGGAASLTLSTLGAGTYAITAAYNATTNFAQSTSAVVQEVVNGAPTKTTLSSVPDPSSFGQNVVFTAMVTAPQSTAIPTGNVAFLEGRNVLGSAAVSPSGFATVSISALSLGSHTITASFGGSINNNASASNSLTQVVLPASTSVSLTGNPNPANVGQAVTFAAVVTSSLPSLPVPAGTITFADQFGVLGAVSLNNGQAALTTSSLAAGTYSVTATFSNGGNYGGSLSSTLLEVVQNHDFSIVLAQPTLTIATGRKATVNVLLTSIGSYTGTLNLGAAQVPVYGSASLTPASLSLASGNSASSVLSIDTAQLPPGLIGKNDLTKGRLPVFFAVVVTLPFAFTRRRSVPMLLAIFAALAVLFTSAGCTNVSYAVNRVAPGTYVIPITATDPNTQFTHSTDLTLVITP